MAVSLNAHVVNGGNGGGDTVGRSVLLVPTGSRLEQRVEEERWPGSTRRSSVEVGEEHKAELKVSPGHEPGDEGDTWVRLVPPVDPG